MATTTNQPETQARPESPEQKTMQAIVKAHAGPGVACTSSQGPTPAADPRTTNLVFAR